MKYCIQQLEESFLCHSAFMKFFYENGLNLYLDQNYDSGDVTILLHKDGAGHYGKLRYNTHGKLIESDLITHKDLKDLITVMKRLWRQGKYEVMTIPRSEFLEKFSV